MKPVAPYPPLDKRLKGRKKNFIKLYRHHKGDIEKAIVALDPTLVPRIHGANIQDEVEKMMDDEIVRESMDQYNEWMQNNAAQYLGPALQQMMKIVMGAGYEPEQKIAAFKELTRAFPAAVVQKVTQEIDATPRLIALYQELAQSRIMGAEEIVEVPVSRLNSPKAQEAHPVVEAAETPRPPAGPEPPSDER